MTHKEKPPQRSKSFSLKRISAFIGFIGVAIGAIIGGSQIIRQVQQSKKIKKDLKMFLEVGDRFAEQFKLNKAIEEYQKAVELDEDNIDAQRRIIAAMRQKLYLEIAPFPKINNVLSRIYKLHALNPHLENDTELLLEEARILLYDDSLYDALNVLEKAHKVAPGNPEVLALLGLVRALTSPKDSVEGLDLLVHAIAHKPDNGVYHYYRAQALEHAQNNAESIREYYQAAKLLSGKDYWSNKLHNKAIKKLDDIFMRFFRDEGALTSSLNMPLKERALIYEYLIGEYEKLSSKYNDLEYSRTGYMAMLYYGLGDFEKADREIRKTFDYWHINYEDTIKNWKTHIKRIPWVELHIKILEEGDLDQNTLINARNYLKTYYEEMKKGEEAEKYREILEITEYGRTYKVGLKVPNKKSDEGLLAVKVFKGYPFDKAGIHQGDMILEIAHRKVREPYDFERVLTKFKLGNDIPVKVKRGNDILFYTLIIE